MYVVRVDPRLCPSPMCGGYWVALANAARTRCQDGLRHPRCYVARALSHGGKPLGSIAEGALVRGAIDVGRDDFGELLASAVYAPAGATAARGGYYRVRDTGIRCVRAPCFSYGVTQVNGSTRIADVRRGPGRREADAERARPRGRGRCTPRTASTRAARSRPASTAGARSTRRGSSSERRCLAPEHVPGEAHVLLGRAEVADREPQDVAAGDPRVRDERPRR